MQDGEHDALSVAGSVNDNRYFVAATLAAIVLAGSAFAYRARPRPRAVEFEEPTKLSSLRAATEFVDDADIPQSSQRESLVEQAFASSPSHDIEAKESKRSKDRRRRGKDPLKDILKSGKRLKSLSLTPSKPSTSTPAADDNDSDYASSSKQTSKDNGGNRNPSADSTPRTPTKRAQKETGTSTIHTARRSAGATSVNHSRGTSEVSQSHQGLPHISGDQRHSYVSDNSSCASSTDAEMRSRYSFASQAAFENDGRRDSDLHVSITQAQDSVLAPVPRAFSAQSKSQPPSVTQPRSPPPRSAPSPASHTSSASSAATTEVSSLMTPATSPTLSHTSTQSSQPGSSSSGTVVSSVLGKTSSPSISAPKNKGSSRKQPSALKNGSSSAGWEWDGLNDTPSTPSSSTLTKSIPKASQMPPKSIPDVDLLTSASPSAVNFGNVASSGSSHASDTPNSSTLNVPSVSMPSSSSQPVTTLLPSTGLSPGMSTSLSADATLGSTSATETSLPSPLPAPAEQVEEEAVHLSFPTLNPPVATPATPGYSTSASNRPRSENHAQNNNNNNGHTSSPRRAPTPRRPPTPSSGVPPPNPSNTSSSSQPSMPTLSTQTQLASLRGALEAARQREEKTKAEIERLTKETESLRWENMNWRRGEVEHQAHVRQLLHQLQSYASVLTSVSPHLNAQFAAQQQANASAGSADGSANASSTPSGYSGASGSGTSSTPQSQTSPGPQLPFLPLHIPMLNNFQMNSMASPAGMTSPVSAGPQTPLGMHPSPFFPYPFMSHPGAPPHPMVGQPFLPHMAQSPTQPTFGPNPFTLGLPPHPSSTHSPHPQASSSSSTGSVSGPPSNAGTSSVGSSSPDLRGSPSPAPGKRRRRTRLNGRINGWQDEAGTWAAGPTIGEDEEGVQDGETDGESGDDGDDGEEVNELLADAILKRPENLRVKSSRGKSGSGSEKEGSVKDKDLQGLFSNGVQKATFAEAEEELPTEFVFPSLSDFGNVKRQTHDAKSTNGDLNVVPLSSTAENVLANEVDEDRPASPSATVVEVENDSSLEQHVDDGETLQALPTSSPESDEKTPRTQDLEAALAAPSLASQDYEITIEAVSTQSDSQ